MSCDDTTALIVDRLKGHISAADEQRLDAHLATCTACRDEAETMTALWEQPRHVRRGRAARAVARALPCRLGRVRSARVAPLDRTLSRAAGGRSSLCCKSGFAAALALVGVLIGQQLPSPVDTEVAALRAEVRTVGLALLDHQSASERLLGVAVVARARRKRRRS